MNLHAVASVCITYAVSIRTRNTSGHIGHIENISLFTFCQISPIALTTAKTVWSFDHSDRVNETF